LLRHKINLGQGAALQTGIDFALKYNPSYIVTFDADGQHSADDIDKLLEPLQNNEADITLGSRFLKPGLHNAATGRKWLIRAARWINYLFSGLFLTDAHNGLRAMTAKAAREFDIRENRMAHATEILLFIRRKKLRYKEVPVTISYTDYSRKKGQSGFNSIRIFFDLALHKLFE
jgi:polyprenyl-phospho-N-acetylgalactosaminyl synthase